MHITFSFNEHIEMLDLDPGFSVSLVEEILAATFNVEGRLQWYVNGKLLRPSSADATLKMLDLNDGDLVSLIAEVKRAAPSADGSTSAGPDRRRRPNQPVYFEGMDAHEVFQYNPNPLMAVQVLRGRPALLKELGFHNSDLANGIGSAQNDEAAADVLREFLLFATVNNKMSQMEEEDRMKAMEKRLAANPNDPEAKRFMEDQQTQELIENQRMTMMAEHPETMFPVLMLYIETKINGVQVQAFVDSGAQTSVMTLSCAKRCGLDRLIDKRHTSKIVGVGTSVALGKIYLAPIQIGGTFFPMSVTVMDSMGDKNMDFLFGLDMLKRHKFIIDLAKGQLSWHGHEGEICAVDFLHEKDLPRNKGGSLEYDPSRPGEPLPDDDNDEEELPAPAKAHEPVMETISAPSAPTTDTSAMDIDTSDTPPQDVEHEAKVQRLIAQGYSRAAVERVLAQLDGDEETAATTLMFEPS